MYRYYLRESCSQFDSLPLTSLTISPQAVVGLKLDSEHEDTCVATIELRGERADSGALQAATEDALRAALGQGLKSFKADFPDAMACVEVSKAAHPDRVVFAKVWKNFKGAILTKELKKQAEALLARP